MFHFVLYNLLRFRFLSVMHFFPSFFHLIWKYIKPAREPLGKKGNVVNFLYFHNRKLAIIKRKGKLIDSGRTFSRGLFVKEILDKSFLIR